ncbi:hypothetical protein AB0K00_12930 [Dactylosporangium sp. NPDC049525]|uniref:hypothetical protein n=1 Tax=Dactylosporangium sp. NPDC049525 TaxID=3154730 RepID=UPI00342676E3
MTVQLVGPAAVSTGSAAPTGTPAEDGTTTWPGPLGGFPSRMVYPPSPADDHADPLWTASEGSPTGCPSTRRCT